MAIKSHEYLRFLSYVPIKNPKGETGYCFQLAIPYKTRLKPYAWIDNLSHLSGDITVTFVPCPEPGTPGDASAAIREILGDSYSDTPAAQLLPALHAHVLQLVTDYSEDQMLKRIRAGATYSGDLAEQHASTLSRPCLSNPLNLARLAALQSGEEFNPDADDPFATLKSQPAPPAPVKRVRTEPETETEAPKRAPGRPKHNSHPWITPLYRLICEPNFYYQGPVQFITTPPAERLEHPGMRAMIDKVAETGTGLAKSWNRVLTDRWNHLDGSWSRSERNQLADLVTYGGPCLHVSSRPHLQQCHRAVPNYDWRGMTIEEVRTCDPEEFLAMLAEYCTFRDRFTAARMLLGHKPVLTEIDADLKGKALREAVHTHMLGIPVCKGGLLHEWAVEDDKIIPVKALDYKYSDRYDLYCDLQQTMSKPL